MPLSVSEITLTELRRQTAAVIDRVGRGEVAVVSKHGRPVALVLPIADEAKLRPAALEEADFAPLIERFAERALERRWSQLLHGRWYNGHGIHGPYPSKSGRRRRKGAR